MRFFFFFAALLLFAAVQSCTADQLPEPASEADQACDSLAVSYDNGIKALLDNNCTQSGCHGSNSINGNFTSFNSLQGYEASIHDRTVVRQNMPPSGSLTEEEIQLLECWKAAGYPEN